MYIYICIYMYYATAIAVAAPPKNLGDRGARCIYIPQQSRLFSQFCGCRYFYASLVFIADLDRSRCRWHVERNRMSKFELEKKLWDLENHRNWLESGSTTTTTTTISPDALVPPTFFVFLFVVARWNLVCTFLASFSRAKMKISWKFRLFFEKWPFFHILDLEYFRPRTPAYRYSSPDFFCLSFCRSSMKFGMYIPCVIL